MMPPFGSRAASRGRADEIGRLVQTLTILALLTPALAIALSRPHTEHSSQQAGISRQGTRPQRDPHAQKYDTYCAGCHGSTLAGGRAPTLLDDIWRFGGEDATIVQSIRDGRAGTEMPPFKEVLSDSDLKGLVAYIRCQAARAKDSAARAQNPAGQIVRAEQHTFKFEMVADGLATPWGLAFLPDGRLLVTERPGALRVIENGKLLPAIEGTPAAWTQQDGGMFDVEVDPNYTQNGWLYLSYSEPGENNTSMTAIIRGRIKGGKWVDQQTLYRAAANLFYPTNIHYGSRFVFDREGHLFYSIGDRGHETEAQDLSLPTGKVHRINPDGTVPRDNPFVGRAGALESIWSYGHRNPQGFAFHPLTGKLWSTEHGPTGGDELNRIESGHNYGWPLVTRGQMFGRGGPPPGAVPPATEKEGMDSPIVFWNPTIAPSGIMFYTADRFPEWKNDLFVTALGGEALRRLETDGDKVVHEEVLFKGFGRVRDVITGPDGYLYVALSIPGVKVSDTTPGAVFRLVPADATAKDNAIRSNGRR
jgi:glucose/arabinose dehydrogenase